MILLASCSSSTKKTKGSRKTTGSAPYELLVVGDKDWLQTTDGSVLKDVIYAEIPGLPQVETCFKVLSINSVGFNKTYQSFANIIVFEISSKYQKAELKTARDVYARPQLVVYLTAPNSQAMAQLASERKEQIVDLFVNAELQRERSYLNSRFSGEVQRQVKKQFGCDIRVPEDINAVKEGKDFMWASSMNADNRLNICVYEYPFTATEDFSKESFIAHRDSFMRENIKGENDNQYMSTNHDYIFVRDIMMDGHYVQEARGLWEMENDMMGGPFVSYAQVDTVKNRVIVAEGFVYAPEKKKRAFIRELEAAIQTLSIK